MKNTIIKTGLIGFGLSGRCFHAPFINTHPAFQLTAVVERHRMDSQKKYPSVKIYRSLKEMIDNEELNLIVITSPNITHVPYAEIALKAGKNVILEKPFTATTSEAQYLIDLAKAKNCMLSIYHNSRYDGDFRTIRQLLDDKIVGEVVEFESHFDRYRPDNPFRGWRGEKLPASGVLYDLGSHLIDQALVLFGKPQSLWADLNYDHNDILTDDGFTIYMKYPNKRVILRAGTLVKSLGPRFILHGEKGSFVKYGLDVQEAALKEGTEPGGELWGDDKAESYGCLSLEGEAKKKIPTMPGNYQIYYDGVAQVILNGGGIPVSGDEGMAVIQIIEAVMKSYKEKRMVNL